MADLTANIAMKTKATLQVHALPDSNIVSAITNHIQHDVNHWIETLVGLDSGLNNRNMQNALERALTAQQMLARRLALRAVAPLPIIGRNTR